MDQVWIILNVDLMQENKVVDKKQAYYLINIPEDQVVPEKLPEEKKKDTITREEKIKHIMEKELPDELKELKKLHIYNIYLN